MSFLSWRKKPKPQLYIGDVQVHFDPNLLGMLLQAHEGFSLTGTQLQKDLQGQIATLLDRPIFNPEEKYGERDYLLHIAITDLRGGSVLHAPAPFANTDIPIPFRPSITLQGYLLSLKDGRLLSERTLTKKPGWPLLFRTSKNIPLRTAAAAMGLASIWTSKHVQLHFEHATVRLVKELCKEAQITL